MHNMIVQRLCQKGFKAYITGGAVRDLFLGLEPTDYDVVTNASADEVAEVFIDQKVKEVGKSFGVCLVNGIEVAGYRKDTYFGLSDKNCLIEPAQTLEEDLARRDLTINAMAFCPYTGEVIDPFFGREDLENKVIRFVGNPLDRIYEDPCRIIRACRFRSKIGGSFHQETERDLKESASLVRDFVRPERIRLEVIKALKTQRASLFFISLDEINALEYIFPSLTKTHIDGGPYHAESVFNHCMFVGDYISTKCSLTKMAGYLHDTGKPAALTPDDTFVGHENIGADLAYEELHSLRFSNEEIDRITGLIKMHMRSINWAKGRGIRKLLSKLKENNIPYREWLRLKFADKAGNRLKENYTLEHRRRLLSNIEKEMYTNSSALSLQDLDITGHDVMQILHLSPGPQVGNTLKFLFYLITEYPELNKKERLIQLLKNREVLNGIYYPRT